MTNEERFTEYGGKLTNFTRKVEYVSFPSEVATAMIEAIEQAWRVTAQLVLGPQGRADGVDLLEKERLECEMYLLDEKLLALDAAKAAAL